MTEQQYLDYIATITSKPIHENVAPYNNAEYLEYTKLNASRTSRWLKTQSLNTSLKAAIQQIKKVQHWILITEPWCGDAAHSVPFIMMAAKENPLITLSIELRDSEPHRIEQYLTNGGKAIPKLVIQDSNGIDLALWGPRPQGCQALYTKLKEDNVPFDQIVPEIQNWYNTNKGAEIQAELLELIIKTVL